MEIKILSKKNKSLQENTIIIMHNIRNEDYIENFIYQFKKNESSILLYDEEHNSYLIPLSTIYYFECVDRKVYGYTKKEVFRFYKNFTQIKKDFKVYGFLQINKNTLLNKNHIQSIKISKDSRRLIVLDNKENLIMNRRCYTLFWKNQNVI